MKPSSDTREYNFDGLVGPTHSYAGLSRGNLASLAHAGQVGNPRAAALQGLEKMRFVAELGVGQAVLPPQLRPDVNVLRRLGIEGDDAGVLVKALREHPQLLRLCSSASSMWTANAATVTPSADSTDGKLHLTVANLSSMFHRSLEARTTGAILRRIFADSSRFAVHDPLPPGELFSDEGAANHTRLNTDSAVLHLFAYGRSTWEPATLPQSFPARHTLEASQAVARLNRLPPASQLFWQQDPRGIDAGAFHTDVLAVGHGNFLMLHERAFVDTPRLLESLKRSLGDTFQSCLASEAELDSARAVRAYPFNCQLLSLPGGELGIVAPLEARDDPQACRFLQRVVAETNPVREVFYIDVNASMKNGGGPACLRLRVPLADPERQAISARVFFDAALYAELKAWIERHYRDRLRIHDLGDPAFLLEIRAALDELTQILRLGSIYDFQQTGP
jgi:succinylarginine dihydrolase